MQISSRHEGWFCSSHPNIPHSQSSYHGAFAEDEHETIVSRGQKQSNR